MARTKAKFPHRQELSYSDEMKQELDKLSSTDERAALIRELLGEYIPIKQKMENPLALPRSFKNENSILNIELKDAGLSLAINNQNIILNEEDLINLTANFTLITKRNAVV